MKVRSSTVTPIDFTWNTGRHGVIAKAKSIARKQFRARLKLATFQDVLSGVEELKAAQAEMAQAKVQKAYGDFMSRMLSKKRSSQKARQLATRTCPPVQDAYGHSSRKEFIGLASGKTFVFASCAEDEENVFA
jgi:hypothetical protein